MEAIELKSNQFWGRRSGAWSDKIPKGHKTPFGNVFNQQQWGSGKENQQGKGRIERRRKRNLWGSKQGIKTLQKV